MKKRIMLVFGTRPEAIKMAPIHRALRAAPARFETSCCVTAQHRALLDQVLASFAIAPDHDLDIMRPRQALPDLEAAVLAAMARVLRAARPDLILVHGDTTTTLAAAKAAFYAGIPVGHVEAGLRSGDLAAPFPEELNRRVVDMIARFRFAPTEQAAQNLIAEGCHERTILVTGNTVIDAVMEITQRLGRDAALRGRADGALDRDLPFDWRREPFVLVTCHRRENQDKGLDGITAALARLAAAFPAVRFVLPLHPNPAVNAPLRAQLGGTETIALCPALAYEAFIQALRHCRFVLSDSGGLQEEALALRKPILVMREVTERPEAVAAGGALLVGADSDRIFAAASRLLTDAALLDRMAAAPNPFGDGTAALRIRDFLAAHG